MRRSLFFGIILNMKSLSSMIPFDFVLKNKFDRDFILKSTAKKSEHFRGRWGSTNRACLYILPKMLTLFLESF